MGTSPLARRTANLVNTQIAFCRLDYGLAGNLIKDKPALGISHLNHADVVVGAVVGTGRATDTGVVIDYYLSRSLDTVNRAGGATEHAHRIEAVHARVSHHQVLYAPAMSIEPRVVVMTHGARFRTRVTPDAAIQIDKHRLRAVDVPVIDQKFDYLRGKIGCCRTRS